MDTFRKNDQILYSANEQAFSHLKRKKTASKWMKKCWAKGLRFKCYNRNYEGQHVYIKPLNCSYVHLASEAGKYGIFTDMPEHPNKFRFERAKFVLF